jgi:hypothetical protein
MADRNWTHEELVVAFNLYCKIPFGRIDHRNPQVIELAKAIGRSPSAVAWKLANFARLDPKLKERKISGASHGSRAEIAVWNEFADNWEKLSFESERLLQKLTGSRVAEPHVSAEFPKGLMRHSSAGQSRLFPDGAPRRLRGPLLHYRYVDSTATHGEPHCSMVR